MKLMIFHLSIAGAVLILLTCSLLVIADQDGDDICRKDNSGCNTRVSSSLVAHWAFNENEGSYASDSSENGNHGELNGPRWVTGRDGPCLQFDGNDYVEIDDHSSLDVTQEITLMAWIRTNDTSGDVGCILGKTFGSNAKNGYYMMVYHNYFYGGVIATGGGNPLGDTSSKIVVADGEWHHVAVTFDGSTARTYVDGVAGNYLNRTGTVTTNSYDINIGRFPNDIYYFDGDIDDVRIYRKALTLDEIREIYGAEGVGPLIGHWNLDDMEGSSAFDDSGMDNHGLVNKAEWTDGLDKGCLRFGNDSSYVDLDDILSDTTFSLALWIKPELLYSPHTLRNAFFFSKTPDSGFYDFYMRIYNESVIEVGYGGEMTVNKVFSDTLIEENKWYHLVFTHSPSDGGKLYVNSVLEDTSDGRHWAMSNAEIMLGQIRKEDYVKGYTGLMDEVAIYNIVLDPRIIKDLYEKFNPNEFGSFEDHINVNHDPLYPDDNDEVTVTIRSGADFVLTNSSIDVTVSGQNLTNPERAWMKTTNDHTMYHVIEKYPAGTKVTFQIIASTGIVSRTSMNYTYVVWESNTIEQDHDEDGLPDVWEQTYFNGTNFTGSDDPDDDGYPNSEEFINGTDPTDPGSSPDNNDGQGDDTDQDDDGMDDKWEIDNFGDTQVSPYSDADGDGYSNYDEFLYGSDPNNGLNWPAHYDTDSDGLDDGWERSNFGDLSENGSNDPDNDGHSNLDEYNADTDPNDPNENPSFTPQRDDEEPDYLMVLIIVVITMALLLIMVFLIIAIVFRRVNRERDEALDDIYDDEPDVRSQPTTGGRTKGLTNEDREYLRELHDEALSYRRPSDHYIHHDKNLKILEEEVRHGSLDRRYNESFDKLVRKDSRR